MPNWFWYALIFMAVALVSWLIVGLIRRLAFRCNILDIPNERSSHYRPMPLCGGAAIVLINVATCAFFGFIHPAISSQHALVFIAAALLVALVSLVDDLGHVRYQIRMAFHVIAALIFVFGYAYWSALNLPLLGLVTLGVLGIPLTLFWIVGLTNAFNFMDGVDGLAAGQALVAGLGWAALGWATGRPLLEALGVVLAATSLGFLVHNWHPATIFMGDVGSTFLGFTFAVLPVAAARVEPQLALAGVLLVWPAIFDSGFTVLSRIRRRQNIFVGHREFLFHRLVAAGWSHSQAALLYMALPILGAGLAFTWDRGTRPLHLGVVLLLSAACVSLWLFVRYREHKFALHAVMARVLPDGPELALAEAGSVDGSTNRRPMLWSNSDEQSRSGDTPTRSLHVTTSETPPAAWDGLERRSGRDRRSGGDRRTRGRRGSDRRTRPGRRATDFHPAAAAMRSAWA